MKIVQLVDGYPPSQDFIHRWAGRLSHALAARGHVIQVLTLAPPMEGPGEPRVVDWGPRDLDEGVAVRRCRVSAPLVALSRALRRQHVKVRSTELRRLLWQTRSTYDLVHLHGTDPPHALWAWICSRVAGRALAITPYLENERHLSSRTTRWLLRHAEAVIVLDAREIGLLKQAAVRTRRLVQVGRPTPDSPLAGDTGHSWRRTNPDLPSEGETLLVFAGPCTWDSGVLTFIDAVRLLRLDGWPAVAAVAGEYGPWNEYMRRLWQTTGVPLLELPVLHPSDRSSLLAAADVIVLPTNWRSGDVFDAWAAGTPALAPRGTGSLLVNELLPRFAAGDPMELFRAIVRLLRDNGAQGLAARGRAQLAEAPGWAEVGTRVEAAYRRMLPTAPQARGCPNTDA